MQGCSPRLLGRAAGVAAALVFCGCLRPAPGVRSRAEQASRREVARKAAAQPYVSEVSGSTAEREDAVRATFEIEVHNPTDRQGEKVLDIAVPPTAAVDRFGMWVQGRYMEGEIAPRARARRVFEQYAYGRGVDPALLTWVRADLCRARVFPIFPRSSTKLLLSYVVPRPPGRSLVLPAPLADIELATTEVGSFRRVFRPRSRGEDDEALRVRAYRPKANEAGHFSADLRVPRVESKAAAADVVLVLRDTSYSMRAGGVPRDILPVETMHKTPRFQIDFDVEPGPARPIWRPRLSGPAPRDFEGATDIGKAFEAAASFLTSRQFGKAHVILVSDGEDTCGEPDPNRWLRPLDRFGPDKVTVSCRSAAPRLAAALGRYHLSERGYTNARVEPVGGPNDLGGSFHAVVRPDGIIRVYGRYEQPEIRLSISYQVSGGVARTKEYVLGPSHDAGNTHLPRLWARARMDDLELAASLAQDRAEREKRSNEARQLALDYQILSPRASFLVLESERDFRESGVERKERVGGWAEADTGAMRTAPAERSAWTPPSGGGACTLSIEEDDPHVLRLDKAYREILGSWGVRHNASYSDDAIGAPYYHPLAPHQVGNFVVAGLTGRYTLEPTQRFRTPPCGWIFESTAEEGREPDAGAVALWKVDFGPLSLGPPGDPDNRWIAGRRAETATLLRGGAAGPGPARFRITPGGIETGLPGLGLVYLNDPRSAVHASYLLDRFPFPTLLPLEYLAKHYDVTAHGEGDTVRVVLAREGEVRVYWLDAEDSLPSRVLVLGIHQNSSYELRCRREDGVLVFEPPEGVAVGRIAVADAAPGRLHGASTGQGIRVGFMPCAPIWQRVLDGTATAKEFMQLAFAEPDEISRLDHLGRAAAPAPRNATVLAFLADCLATLGRKDEALATVVRARSLLTGLPTRRADGLKLLLAGVEARLSTDKAVPFERLAGELGKRSAIGRAASEWAETVRGGRSARFVPSQKDAAKFWPPTVSPVWRRARRYDLSSPEFDRIKELIRAVDAEGLARVLTDNTDLIEPALALVAAALRGPHGDQGRLSKWPEQAALRFFDAMSRSSPARAKVSSWLLPYEDAAKRWCAEKLKAHPEWRQLASAYLRAIASSADEVGNSQDHWGYGALTRARELTGPEFPTCLRVRARALIMRHYGWALEDLPRYWEETLGMLGSLEGELDRWHVLSQLLRAGMVSWPRMFRPGVHGSSPDDIGRMIRACLRLPEARHFAYFANHNARLPRTDWGWLDSVARYLAELAREGRVDEAVRRYEAFFAAHPRPVLRAYLEVAARDAPLGHENALARAGEFMLREKSASELVDLIVREGGKPSPIILREVSRRGIGREVSHECIRRFAEAPQTLAWAVFESPRDEEMAREALRAVRSLRARLSMDHLFSRELLGLCFRNGLLEETIAEAREAETAAPSETWVSLVRASARSVLDSEEKGVPGWRALIERLGSSGRAYSAAVSCLKAVHRYQEAYELRKQAIEASERPRQEGVPQTGEQSWEWLERPDQKLVDNAVVKRGEKISLPGTGDFREELATTAVLARWKDHARILDGNFDGLKNDDERFAALDKMLLTGTRLREPCPALESWLKKHIAERRPMSIRWGYRLYCSRWMSSVDAMLDYAGQFAEKGDAELARRFARVALDEAVTGHMAEDVIIRSFRAAVDRFGVSARTLVNRFSWFRNPSDRMNEILDEAAFDSARDVIETGKWDATWTAEVTKRMNGRPALRRKVDDFARSYVRDGENAAAAAIVCARTGWGKLPEDECWRIAAKDPALLAFGFEQPYLDHLRSTRQWEAALGFLGVLDRRPHYGHRNRRWRADILAEAGRMKDAVSFAREHRLYKWLIERGREDVAEEVILTVLAEKKAEIMGREFRSSSGLQDPVEKLFAVRVWAGRVEEAAEAFQSNLAAFRDGSSLSNEFSAIQRVAVYAFNSEYEPESRKEWKSSAEGESRALDAATVLLASGEDGWETTALAAMCCVPAAYQGASREVRARAYRLLTRAFGRLGRNRQTAVATLLRRGMGGPWHREEPDPLDPLPEHVLASIAAAEACGGFFPGRGLPFEPDHDGWGKLPRARRLELLRRASRLLEVYPASGPIRRGDLSALERYEYPSELAKHDPGFVPTPRQWLMREMRRRRHLCVRAD